MVIKKVVDNLQTTSQAGGDTKSREHFSSFFEFGTVISGTCFTKTYCHTVIQVKLFSLVAGRDQNSNAFER